MNRKLTLKLDGAVIDGAKEYAETNHESVSGLVERFLKALTVKKKATMAKSKKSSTQFALIPLAVAALFVAMVSSCASTIHPAPPVLPEDALNADHYALSSISLPITIQKSTLQNLVERFVPARMNLAGARIPAASGEIGYSATVSRGALILSVSGNRLTVATHVSGTGTARFSGVDVRDAATFEAFRGLLDPALVTARSAMSSAGDALAAAQKAYDSAKKHSQAAANALADAEQKLKSLGGGGILGAVDPGLSKKLSDARDLARKAVDAAQAITTAAQADLDRANSVARGLEDDFKALADRVRLSSAIEGELGIEADVTISADLQLTPDWKPDLHLAATISSPQVSIDLDRTTVIRTGDFVSKVVDLLMPAIEAGANAYLGTLDLAKYVSPLWQKLGAPISVHQGPDAWLSLSRMNLGQPLFSSNAHTVTVDLSLGGKLDLSVGDRPSANVPGPLPKLHAPDSSRSFSAYLSASVAYKPITDQIMAILGGKPLPIDTQKIGDIALLHSYLKDFQLSITEVLLSGNGSYLIGDVFFSSRSPNIRGDVYFYARPILDEATQTVSLSDIKFELSTSSGLLNAVGAVVALFATDAITKAANSQLAAATGQKAVNSALSLANDNLKSLTLMPGVVLSAEAASARIENLRFRKDGFIFDTHVTGSASVTVDALQL